MTSTIDAAGEGGDGDRGEGTAGGDRHQRTARALLPLVGGAGNITSVEHCMTRLRLGLRDRAAVRDAELRALPGVLGVVEDDTYQVVLGPGPVAAVTAEVRRLVEAAQSAPASLSAPGPAPDSASRPDPGPDAGTDLTAAERGAEIRERLRRRNATPGRLLLRRIAAVFVPLIPALIACGIVAGVNGLLRNAGWLVGVQPALTAVSGAFFSVLAVFVGINAAREFGGTPVVGGAVAAVVVYPGVAEVSVGFLGADRSLAPGQGGVLGALGAAVLAAYLERWCQRWVPEAVSVLLTPTLAVLGAGLVTLYLLMFVAGEVAEAIGWVADWLMGTGGAVAGFVLAGFFLPLVMLGLHQALIPIHTTLIEQDGYTVLLPILAMAGAGQVGAAAAVYLRLPRNPGIRATIRSALPAGLLGIGEPLIYGVSLPLGRPFITACVGGAFGGGVVGLFNQLGTDVGSTAIGPSGWALFPLVTGDSGLGATVAVYGLGLVAGYVAGFVVTYFFGFSRQMLEEFDRDPSATPRPSADATSPTASSPPPPPAAPAGTSGSAGT
ncbi:PTS transporter subunit EIIC [Allostreptomyces psammosilenae]|uniref:PTS system sucrose-specific IIC component n=1 Tax=Allostreptomyces psammosilenae TaxID=1892865 RepID=A0A852ZZT9_9ACTN|nr:PTS transporter subunit EIIC [Allostreptomyces psammosilenae]NYI07635.1 PTS system sucrose-specific IIC component [Allostreptomyces psammosilenae]